MIETASRPVLRPLADRYELEGHTFSVFLPEDPPHEFGVVSFPDAEGALRYLIDQSGPDASFAFVPRTAKAVDTMALATLMLEMERAAFA